MTDAPTPGWYHAEGDPPDTQRYWDGTSWQGDPQPTAPTPTPATAAPSSYGGAGVAQPMVQGMYAEKSQSTMALILSIFGLVCCGIAGPIGWYMGQQELNGIEAGLRDPSGKGTANAAKIIGIIATALWVLGIIFYAIALVVAAADSA